MKSLIILLALFLFVSCQNEKREIPEETPVVKTDTSPPPINEIPKPPVHANDRFRNVTVEKLAENEYQVSGEGQIFEANSGWVVEDGHNVLKKGYAMTDAGAPDWGRFNFTLDVAKDRENSTLTLILFESSAKDGSRVHELPIALNKQN